MASDDESTSSGSGFGPTEDDMGVSIYPVPGASDDDLLLETLSEHTPDEGSTDSEPAGPVAMAARAYQLEMLEASLRENTIVAVRAKPASLGYLAYMLSPI